jgi:RNA polymerase sigma-70 factor (ECF subfamily)
MELSEHDLETIRLALAGDQGAFEVLVGRFARLIYAQSFSLLHDHSEAEDVVQECFLKAYRFRCRLAQPERFPQWLLAIARNLARDRLRRHDWRDRAGPETDMTAIPDGGRSPSGILEVLDDVGQLRVLVAGLPERARRALLLRYVVGLGHREIQSRLGLSAGALRGVLGRGLLALRRNLG